eukprot:scaffold70598_cov60-Attheya_sp.AAC.7
MSNDQHRSDKEEGDPSRVGPSSLSLPLVSTDVNHQSHSGKQFPDGNLKTPPKQLMTSTAHPKQGNYPSQSYYHHLSRHADAIGTISPLSNSPNSYYGRYQGLTHSPRSAVQYHQARLPSERVGTLLPTTQPEASVVTPIQKTENHPSTPPQYRGPPLVMFNNRERGTSVQTDMTMHSPQSQYSPGSASTPAPSSPPSWACDFCNVATFATYEETCAHEAVCTGRNSTFDAGGHLKMRSRAPQMSFAGNLHLPYKASPGKVHASEGMNGIEGRDGPSNSSSIRGLWSGANAQSAQNQTIILLSMPTDVESLSDRQCFVRSKFVEVFAATELDVSARHSKGAQKLIVGQVGIRCVFCRHLRPRDRAERAVCYPSSISRIYQTVADMQRFHFEACHEIPDEVRSLYKSLKTTRPRGVGSPQSYWVQSAKLMDLIDSQQGIRFSTDSDLTDKKENEN